MIQPWKKISSKPVGDFRIFKLRSDIAVNPRTGKEHDFFVLDSVNWVNVIAVTPDQKLVMIHQYRHGSGTVELEIPGGMMDPHETDPVATAVRELREETGYAGENARLLGRIHSNPAILSNTTFTVLIENCRLQHGVEFDHGEDLETRLVPVAEIPKLVADEKIGHSLVIVALYYFDLWQRGIKKPSVTTPVQTMKNEILFGILLVSTLNAGLVTSPAALPESNDMTQALEIIRKKHDLPALAAVVVKDGRICDRVAVGVRKWGDATPVTTDDVFHIGSCTKSMTATLTAMLIEEGKLSWDTTIADVFPELKGKMDKQYETVTIEQLLTHHGGVPGAPPAAAWKRAWEQQGTPTQQRREFIEAVLSQPPEAAPGTKMIYSNQGYAIVGAMLEKITGQDYETLITEKLFKPLHMDSAAFGPPGTIGKIDQPWGHIRKLGMIVPLQSDNPPAIAPAGRVHCSLDDLARFTIFHMQRGQSGGLLKPETLVKLHTPPAGGDYACGWVVLKRGWAGGNALMHNGSNTMWYVVMWLAPEKNFSVVVGTNIAGPDAEQGCDEVAAAMIHKWLPQ